MTHRSVTRRAFTEMVPGAFLPIPTTNPRSLSPRSYLYMTRWTSRPASLQRHHEGCHSKSLCAILIQIWKWARFVELLRDLDPNLELISEPHERLNAKRLNGFLAALSCRSRSPRSVRLLRAAPLLRAHSCTDCELLRVHSEFVPAELVARTPGGHVPSRTLKADRSCKHEPASTSWPASTLTQR